MLWRRGFTLFLLCETLCAFLLWYKVKSSRTVLLKHVNSIVKISRNNYCPFLRKAFAESLFILNWTVMWEEGELHWINFQWSIDPWARPSDPSTALERVKEGAKSHHHSRQVQARLDLFSLCKQLLTSILPTSSPRMCLQSKSSIVLFAHQVPLVWQQLTVLKERREIVKTAIKWILTFLLLLLKLYHRK